MFAIGYASTRTYNHPPYHRAHHTHTLRRHEMRTCRRDSRDVPES